MKTIKIALFLVLVSVGIALATNKGEEINQPESTSISIATNGNAATIKLVYTTEEKEKVLVSILDNTGKLIYKDHIIAHKSFIRPYNVQNLKEGNYTILVKSSKREWKKEFEVKKPIKNTLKDSQVMVRSLNKYQYLVGLSSVCNGTYKVSIYNNDELIYVKTMDTNKEQGLVFNLSKIDLSQVKFEITKGNNTVVKTF